MNDDLIVSGPFNVQHIPKVKTVQQLEQNLDSSTHYRTRPCLGTGVTNNPSKVTTTTFSSNTIVVCTHAFNAEYDNEMSCNPGDVFKLVDPKCVNGWILTMSITSGVKGWIPKDNVKVLDLQNSVPIEADVPIRSSSGSISTSKSTLKRVSEVESCKTEISTESSLLDYYSPNSIGKADSIETDDTVYNSLTYSSIFTHSMYFLESSASTFWYRIDLSSRLNPTQKIHICRYYSDIFELNRKLQLYIKRSNLNIKLPLVPRSLGLNSNRDSIGLLSSNLSALSNYLKELLYILDSISSNSYLVKLFEDFCAPKDNDFQHYVELNDDQILNILKPKSCSRNSNIEIDFNTPLPKPSRTFSDNRTAASISSSNSKYSFETASHSKPDNVKVKLIHKDEYLMVKLTSEDLNFHSLKNKISAKLNISGFTLAYRNDQHIFVLLRDDKGLQKALDMNSRRLVIKVI